MEKFETCFVCGRVFTLEEDIYKVGDDYLCAHCHGKAFTDDEWERVYAEAGGDDNDEVYYTTYWDNDTDSEPEPTEPPEVQEARISAIREVWVSTPDKDFYRYEELDQEAQKNAREYADGIGNYKKLLYQKNGSIIGRLRD